MGYAVQSVGQWQDWTPVFTGFSVDPPGSGRYSLVGKICHVYWTPSAAGTSNATTFTMTLPFAAANTVSQIEGQIVENGGTIQQGRVSTAANSNILTVGSTVAGAAWTASGGKSARICFSYEIA